MSTVGIKFYSACSRRLRDSNLLLLMERISRKSQSLEHRSIEIRTAVTTYRRGRKGGTRTKMVKGRSITVMNASK